MIITKQHVWKNPIVLTSVVMAILGWLITFIGACITGRGGTLWWIIIYELLLLKSIFFSITRDVFHQYQIMFAIFMGTSISMLTSTIDNLMNDSSPGSQIAGAGAIILIIMQFFWVILFGSTEDSVVCQIVYSGHNLHVGSTSKESKVALSSPETNGHYSVSTLHQNQLNTPINPSILLESQQITATALHSYTANPEDPNELSFGKNEVLEILNKSGNWWQAKKQDGTVGIVPSNYFAQ